MQQEDSRPSSLGASRVAQWLAEDVATGDATTEAIVPQDARASALWVAKSAGVFAGVQEALAVFRALDPALVWQPQVEEGAEVVAGTVLVRFSGSGRAVLTGERAALNIAQRMSGIATATRACVRAVEGTGARILDTRKTVPGLRDLDKKAVAIGGGRNHRMGLYDMAMIKDNHIVAAGGIAAAVAAVRAHAPGLPVEVEVTDFDELDQALAAGVEWIMLDNMAPERMAEAVRRVGGRARLEASGNVGLHNLREVALSGVDFVSLGALTHSVTAFDISQRLERLEMPGA